MPGTHPKVLIRTTDGSTVSCLYRATAEARANGVHDGPVSVGPEGVVLSEWEAGYVQGRFGDRVEVAGTVTERRVSDAETVFTFGSDEDVEDNGVVTGTSGVTDTYFESEVMEDQGSATAEMAAFSADIATGESHEYACRVCGRAGYKTESGRDRHESREHGSGGE